jgi:oligosaccharide repeat unit polymerase
VANPGTHSLLRDARQGVIPLAPGRLLPPTAIAIALLAGPACLSAALLIIGQSSRWVVATQVLVYAVSVFGLLWYVVVRRRFFNDIGWVFLIVGHIFWFAGPALYQVLRPGLWFGDWIGMDVPDDALVTAGFLIALFLAANGLGYYLLRRPSSDLHMRVRPDAFLIPSERRILLVVILLVIGLMPYILFGGGLADVIRQILMGRATKSWALTDLNPAQASGTMTFFWITRAFLVSSGLLSGIYFTTGTNRRLKSVVYALIMVFVTVLILFDRGTRSQSAMVLIPVLVVFIFRRSFKRGTYSVLRLVIPTVLIAAVLLGLMQFVRFYRYEYSRELVTSMTISQVFSPKQDTDFYTEAANAVVVRRDLTQDINESPLLYFVINPIPRVIWSGKPVSMTQWHYTMYRWGIDIFKKGGNALPSVVGQYYMNFGIPGVIWGGLVFGVLVGWIERRLLQSRLYFEQVALAASAFTFVFLSFRFFTPSFHYSTLLLLLIILFYSRRIGAGRRARSADIAGSMPHSSWA